MNRQYKLMARLIAEKDLQTIEAIVGAYPQGISIQAIQHALPEIPRRTLQYRLKALVERGRLISEGEKRGVRYRLASLAPSGEYSRAQAREEQGKWTPIPLSTAGTDIRNYVGQPLIQRHPVGYQSNFLDTYRPNESAYLSNRERSHLRQLGQLDHGQQEQAAGTYAKQVLNRLLIDLSWNSSRLEGNTYSLLETRRLLDFGEVAEGKESLEAQMILNHKDAIEFLVESADDIEFNRYTLLNLHALLANNLLGDPGAAGRLRSVGVGIGHSVFHPLEVPWLIEECFDQLLATAAAIDDPFEQAFFVMAQIPYLQPFDDVNKRLSRLAANISFIVANLKPLSFTELPTKLYTQAMLGVYELNRIDLLKDVFIWAYERSAARYTAVRQSLGEPDAFRLKHRDTLREIIGDIVRQAMGRKSAIAYLVSWIEKHIEMPEREHFREVTETELLSLHHGNFARYRIRPGEFEAWWQVWSKPPPSI